MSHFHFNVPCYTIQIFQGILRKWEGKDLPPYFSTLIGLQRTYYLAIYLL